MEPEVRAATRGTVRSRAPAGRTSGRVRLHGGEDGAEVVEEVVPGFELEEGFALVAELADGGFEVVGLLREVVVVVGGEGFLQGGEFAVGILAAVEHVTAVEVDAGTEHDGHHGGDVVGGDDGAAVIGDLHAATHFGGHEGGVGGEVGGVAGGGCSRSMAPMSPVTRLPKRKA